MGFYNQAMQGPTQKAILDTFNLSRLQISRAGTGLLRFELKLSPGLKKSASLLGLNFTKLDHCLDLGEARGLLSNKGQQGFCGQSSS